MSSSNEPKRCTQFEKEERIVETMKMVIKGNSTADIKRVFRSRWNIQWNQALRYLRLARERLRDDNDLSEDFTLADMKVQHYAMFMKIAGNEEEETKDRITALVKAGAIYGVNAQKKIAPINPAGDNPHAPLAMQVLRGMTLDELMVLKKAKDRMLELSKSSVAVSP